MEHCASCHGAHRLGGAGPALLPENLGCLKKEAAADAIRNGRLATQMPPFGAQLDDTAIQQLIDFVCSRPAVEPVRDSVSIDASRNVLHAPGSLSNEPVFSSD